MCMVLSFFFFTDILATFLKKHYLVKHSKYCIIHLLEVPTTVKFIQTESQMAVTRVGALEEFGVIVSDWHGAEFWRWMMRFLHDSDNHFQPTEMYT